MRWLSAFSITLLLALAGCVSRPGSSVQCRFNNECATGLVCAAGECRKQCNDARDCPGESCAPGELPGSMVCISTTEPPQCLYDSDCPMARDVCSPSRRCVLGCAQDYDCRVMDPRTSCDQTTHACYRDCSRGAVTCSEHAQCQQMGRDAVCVCLRGYSGPNCTDCEFGFQDNDRNGTCEPDCMSAGLSCAAPNVCSDILGTAVCRLPNDCEDLRRNGVIVDGDQTLYADGMQAHAWTAYCANMATGPAKTYLSLVSTAPNTNYAEAPAGGLFMGTTIRTTYQRIRVDGATLGVDVTDNTFATTTGGPLTIRGAPINYLHFASATACGATSPGAGNVNLVGTPFSVASTFRPNAPLGVGNATLSSLNQVVDFSVNGGCGEIQPDTCFGRTNPVNSSPMPVYCLALQWAGP